ncbi:MAG: GntR family transcriptional regulator [Polaribacter sp.]|nr:GntR family transcriptional regulator [Polaribacter sp.]
METKLNFTILQIEIAFNEVKVKGANKYSKLYLAIKGCITNSIFPNNWQLPSTRILAIELKLSRTTVLKTYELLLLENLITPKQGSGYRVNFLGEVQIEKTKLPLEINKKNIQRFQKLVKVF